MFGLELPCQTRLADPSGGLDTSWENKNFVFGNFDVLNFKLPLLYRIMTIWGGYIMRAIFVAVCCYGLLGTNAGAQQAQLALESTSPEIGHSFVIPAYTSIWFSPERAINSRTLKKGERFPIYVSRNVAVGNGLIVPKGTPGIALVTYRTGRGIYGKSAKLEFEIDSLKIGDFVVPMRGNHRLVGTGNAGWTLASVVIFGALPAMVVIGHSAVAGEQSEFEGRVREATTVPMVKAGSLVPIAAAEGATMLVHSSTNTVSRQRAQTPSGWCLDVPRNYFGTGSTALPIPNRITPACWEVNAR